MGLKFITRNGLKNAGTLVDLWSENMLHQSVFPTSLFWADLHMKEVNESPCLLYLTNVRFK